MALSVGSLFSGIGGIDLGLERAGMDTRWFVEIDSHCRNILARHWPGLPIYGDITAIDWAGVEGVDVLAGGFPCQPVSVAGRALAQDDPRWLWPAFRDAIGALRPRYVLVENVPGLLQRGLGIVLGDLAQLGYDAEWECIPAAAVGAPHLRNRLWLVAYPQRDSGHVGPQLESNGRQNQAEQAGVGGVAMAYAGSRGGRRGTGKHTGRGSGPSDRSEDVPDTHSRRLKEERITGLLTGIRAPRRQDADRRHRTLPDANGGDAQGLQSQRHDPPDGREPAERSPGLFGGAGPRGEWPPEPDVGRVAHGIPHRVDRLRALGNAVVPQVVEWIGRRIVAFDEGRA